jgi:spermidine synthase
MRSPSDSPQNPAVTSRPPGFRLALILYAIAGMIALGYEVIWSQAIVQWTGTRTFAFAMVLATYLAGLGIGSAWYARRADRSRDPWGDFGLAANCCFTKPGRAAQSPSSSSGPRRTVSGG